MEDSKQLAHKVGTKIREFRQQQGLSLEALALACDMNPAFLGHVERGMRCPTIYTLERICKGLNISLAELFLEDAGNNAAIAEHINRKLSQLTPEQAQKIAVLVDDALTLLSL